jgi:hypothetical protein
LAWLFFTLIFYSLSSTEEFNQERNGPTSVLPSVDMTRNQQLYDSNNRMNSILFDKNVRPKVQKYEIEEEVFDNYRNHHNNKFGIPKEVSAVSSGDKRNRPASAAIPEKITISFGGNNSHTNSSANFHETNISALSSSENLSAIQETKGRPVSAPMFKMSKKSEDLPNNSRLPSTKSGHHSNQPAGKQPSANFSNNKASMEAVYTTSYLKTPPVSGYVDTTALSDRNYNNAVYQKKDDHNLFLPRNLPQNSHPSSQHSGSPHLMNTMNSAQSGSSLRRKSGSGAGGLSAVDRALSIGKSSQQILQERDNLLPPTHSSGHGNRNRATKLNEMLESNIVEKLDHLILNNR